MCEVCADNLHNDHVDKECPACGEDVCFICAEIYQKMSYKVCCTISEPHVHCPECNIICDEE